MRDWFEKGFFEPTLQVKRQTYDSHASSIRSLCPSHSRLESIGQSLSRIDFREQKRVTHFRCCRDASFTQMQHCAAISAAPPQMGVPAGGGQMMSPQMMSPQQQQFMAPQGGMGNKLRGRVKMVNHTLFSRRR